MAKTILHYGTEYLGTPAQLGVIPEGVLIVDPDTNTIKIGNGVAVGGVNVTVQADVAFSDITGKPTTLAGYGITDAQSILVSGTDIKTVNGTTLLGSGDVTISGGASTLGALSDVNNTAPSWNNQPLVWDGSSEWKPAQDLFVDDLKAFTKLTLDGQGTYIEWIGNLNPPFYTIKLNVTGNATQNETITLPNATGTVALTSDIPAGTTINNNSDNRIITGSNTADTLNADGNFTWNGTYVNVIGNIITSGTISGGNTTVSGDLTFYNDAGADVVGYIRNNNDRLEFFNANALRMFYFFNAPDHNIQVERPLIIASNQYLSTPKIQQNQGATGGIEITGGEAGTVVIQTGTNNEINVTGGLVDVTGNITASGTISGIMQLPVLSAAPSSPADGMMAIADGTNWNVHGGTTPGLTIYYDGQWWPGTPFVV